MESHRTLGPDISVCLVLLPEVLHVKFKFLSFEDINGNIGIDSVDAA